MSLMVHVRQQVIQALWAHYISQSADARNITAFISPNAFLLDHFALIDLPGIHTGISTLNQIFSALNYLPQGRDYLADKQNEFMWLAPAEAQYQFAADVLPQVVIADFALEHLPINIQSIITKYSRQSPAFPWRYFHQLCGRAYQDDIDAANILSKLIIGYCCHRDWPITTLKEYYMVKEFNELLSWVLIFGRQPSHFGLAIQHLTGFKNLEDFNRIIKENLIINLHQQGKIQGGVEKGIAQSATEAENYQITLADGAVTLNGFFVEFVWRFSQKTNPILWADYFRGFIGTQANQVIESVYEHDINALPMG